MLELGTHDGVALTRFVVLEPDDRPQLAVEVENGAVLDVIGGDNHGSGPFGIVGWEMDGWWRQVTLPILGKCSGIPV